MRLSDLLASGPVVLTWYRGGWCPYCNLALRALQQRLPEFQNAGAQIVALAPEQPEHTAATTQAGGLDFPVLTDPGNRVARDYGIVFTMSEPVAQAMRDKHKTHERNADDSNALPLAAAYVIDPSGTIQYAFIDADYRERAEPSRLLDAVHASTRGFSPRHRLLQFWETVWNPPYDLSVIDRWLTEDFVLTSAGRDIAPRSAFKGWVQSMHQRIDNLRLDPLETFVGDDGQRVVSRWRVTGRNRGFQSDLPEGAPIAFTGIAVWQVRGESFAHNWVERSVPLDP